MPFDNRLPGEVYTCTTTPGVTETGLRVSAVGIGTRHFGGEWCHASLQDEVDAILDPIQSLDINGWDSNAAVYFRVARDPGATARSTCTTWRPSVASGLADDPARGAEKGSRGEPHQREVAVIRSASAGDYCTGTRRRSSSKKFNTRVPRTVLLLPSISSAGNTSSRLPSAATSNGCVAKLLRRFDTLAVEATEPASAIQRTLF